MHQSKPTIVRDQPPDALTAMQPRPLRTGRPVRLLIGALISGVALYLSFRNLQLGDVAAGFASADLALIGWALVCVLINIMAKALRWRVLLGPGGQALSLLDLLRALLVGQTLNIALPSRAGDVSRAYMAGAGGAGWAYVAGTIISEKAIDLICYTLCFALALLLLPPLPTWMTSSVYSFVVMTAIIAVLLILLPHGHRLLQTRYLTWLPRILRDRVGGVLQAVRSSFGVARHPLVIAQLAGWSALVWVTAVLPNYLLLRALAIEAPAVSALLLLIVLQISVSLPSVPGNVGLFQYVCVLTLGVFGVAQSVALSYGILLHVVAFLPPIVLAGLLVVFTRARRPAQA